MDTTQLTTALRDATDGLEPPRAGFTTAVLAGGRRRRTRGRVAIGAAIAGTAAVVVAAAVVLPHQLAAPPPADRPAGKSTDLLRDSGGDLVDDRDTVRLAVTAWQDAVDRTPANVDGHLNDRLGTPHVYWAGTTPSGPAAVVTQAVVLGSDDRLEPSDRGREVIAVGLLATNPADTAKREFELVAVQLDGDSDGPGGFFVFPDNRTVLGVEHADLTADRLALFVSPNTTIREDGRSRRTWTELASHDGVAFTQLPAPANEWNVRIVVGPAGGDPNAGEQKLGAHLPLLSAAAYIDGRVDVTVDNGLGWPPADMTVGEHHQLPRSPVDLFHTALRESDLLDPASFEEAATQWLVIAGLADGRTMIVGAYEEGDNPEYLYLVLVRADGSVEKVTRGPQAKPVGALPVRVRLPGGQGWVVAAMSHQLSYRTDGAWSTPVTSAALLPDATTQVRVDGQTVELPR